MTEVALSEASLALDQPLVVVVVHDPTQRLEQRVARRLLDHFQSTFDQGLDLGLRISVVPIEATEPPDLEAWRAKIGQPLAMVAVVLLSKDTKDGSAWGTFWSALQTYVATWGRAGRILPVGLGAAFPSAFKRLNIVPLKSADGRDVTRLLRATTLVAAQTLRFAIKRADPANRSKSDIVLDREKDSIFISHSKHDHDDAGVKAATKIRRAIVEEADLVTFFDVSNIRPGEDFEEAIFFEIAQSLLVAVHTDTYSSREWCRKELLAAKRHERPAVVAGCIRDIDRRSFPYLGNTPYVALASLNERRVGIFVLRVFDEMLRHYVWLARTGNAPRPPNTYFLGRAPELLSLASTLQGVSPDAPACIVYPDPPIGEEEKRLIEALRSDLTLLSLAEWRAL